MHQVRKGKDKGRIKDPFRYRDRLRYKLLYSRVGKCRRRIKASFRYPCRDNVRCGVHRDQGRHRRRGSSVRCREHRRKDRWAIHWR